ncbi:glycosyltransferase [Aequorivita viscosa]|nr:glycosyltransferase [Aequorivita viscosa]
MIKFSILITTKNRREELRKTLSSLTLLNLRNDVECLVYDDGSKDGTPEMIKTLFPNIELYCNRKSRGYLFNRNYLLNKANGLYAISLDDDANFITEDILCLIEEHFKLNFNCGLIACRIFWGDEVPKAAVSSDASLRVQGFVGCGHIWNMQAWNDIPDYPEWFVFYGEEQYAAFHLFKKKWQVHYHPGLFVHHRVNLKRRKMDKDYVLRLRRSLGSGWYLYFLFYPLKQVPRMFLYSLVVQFKTKVLKGDFLAFGAIVQAMGDLIYNTPKIYENINRLSKDELKEFNNLPETKIYWNPQK